MHIQIFERFDQDGDVSIGDLWETITWDFLRPTRHTVAPNGSVSAGWQLKCDFRLPAHGVLRIAHPTDDTRSVELRYDTPSVVLPHHLPGAIRQKSFTEALRLEWDALPCEIEFVVGRMTLVATKDIVDAVESTVLGELYIYRPSLLRIE